MMIYAYMLRIEMRTTINIDNDLMEKAQSMTGMTEKR
ncbi:MAG TPA: hypothetical protein EYN12_06755 [Deltaproteobacteria bacterium]|nr:hypothetical protein [Deltaproteobacteria bacterium]